MKKILFGKVYDTDKAALIGEWQNGGRGTTYISETLYRKRTGEFFIHCQGGAMTKYAQAVSPDRWSGGSKIIPLAWEAAQEWAEEHLTAEEYEAAFGPVPEDDSRMTVALSLSTSAVERAKRAAAQQGMNLSKYVEALLEGGAEG